ncbi:MAG: MotA/TolQ/ExbB proton channel family protein [Verrucomicrobiota bacterium]
MLEEFNESVFRIWASGGSLMILLAILAFIIYGTIIQILIYTARLKELRKDENRWNHWVDRPEDSDGIIGKMIQYTQDGVTSKSDVSLRFRILKNRVISPLDSQIRFGAAIVTTAPLLGLLGTVMGMLATFLGLSVSYGGNSLDLVAGGISEALITTQTGLVIAVPAMFLLVLARSQRSGMDHFLTQLEGKTIQTLERKGTFN